MKYYELRNRKTGREFSAVAKNLKEACQKMGEKPLECKCIYSVEIEERA